MTGLRNKSKQMGHCISREAGFFAFSRHRWITLVSRILTLVLFYNSLNALFWIDQKSIYLLVLLIRDGDELAIERLLF